MYAGDTFFHLSPVGQIGLGLLSVFLASIYILGFIKISTRFAMIVKVPLAIVLLWFFIWLSPQIYYLYYRMIFDTLPLQWVIQTPPSILSLLEIIFFFGDSTLSAHSKGILFWLMIGACIIRRDRVAE